MTRDGEDYIVERITLTHVITYNNENYTNPVSLQGGKLVFVTIHGELTYSFIPCPFPIWAAWVKTVPDFL